jgi:hypothetical protein
MSDGVSFGEVPAPNDQIDLVSGVFKQMNILSKLNANLNQKF